MTVTFTLETRGATAATINVFRPKLRTYASVVSGLSKPGVFYQGNWYLDVNGNNIFDAGDMAFGWGVGTDKAIVGKW